MISEYKQLPSTISPYILIYLVPFIGLSPSQLIENGKSFFFLLFLGTELVNLFQNCMHLYKNRTRCVFGEPHFKSSPIPFIVREELIQYSVLVQNGCFIGSSIGQPFEDIQ